MPDVFLIDVAVAPVERSDLPKLHAAFKAMEAEDLTFGFVHDAESGQFIAKGVNEAQLDANMARLAQTCPIEIGALQVAYRETLLRRVEIDETHKRHIGGAGPFARVKIIFEPTERGAGSSFESQIAGGAVPQEYIPAVETGINSVMGLLAGFPVVDVKATLIDGAFHDVDSSVSSFKMVARSAFRRALKETGSTLLEPIMEVEVTIPEDYIGFVVGDFSARRGHVQGGDRRDKTVVVKAMVPLANMFGYVNQLRSGTQGHGSFSMRFSHYAPAPPSPDDDGPFAPAVAKRA